MPREFARKDRVAGQIKRELGVLMTRELKDPRVRLAAITDVDLSPDLKHARVYVASFDVTAPGGDHADEMLAGLRAARGFLKRELGKRLRLRVMPQLRFCEDATEREAHRLDRVIESALAHDRADAPADTPAAEPDRVARPARDDGPA